MDERANEEILSWDDWDNFISLRSKLENLPKGERAKLKADWLKAVFDSLKPSERRIARRMLRDLEALRGIGELGAKELLAHLGLFLVIQESEFKRQKEREKGRRRVKETDIAWFKSIWRGLKLYES